ncbi:MAG: hypothetical protein WCK88_02755 [bacterium]
MDVLRKYLEILTPIVNESNINNKEVLLYDIRRVQMINSISSIEEVIKKTIRTIYNKGDIQEKKEIYKIIAPIAKHVNMFIFPPWFFILVISTQGTFSMLKIIF